MHKKYRPPKLEAVELTVKMECECQCGLFVGGGSGTAPPVVN